MIEVNMNSMDGVVLMTAGKKIEENIKVTPVASLILPEYDGAYELLVPSVSGVWVFNDALNEVHEGLNCENLTYTMVDVDISYKGLGFRAADGSMYPLDEPDIDFYSGGGWNDEFQTIDFGTEPQEVSEEFLAWLTANAVKQ